MADLTCEICGEREAGAIVQIEGAKLAACAGCARGGKILYRLDREESHEQVVVKEYRAPMEREEITEDCAKILKEKLEKAGIPLEVLAERINEAESYLHSIEKGKLHPTLAVARKLEKELGIKLVQTVMEDVVPMSEKRAGAFKEPTLADVFDFQKKQKKEGKKAD